MGSTVENKVSVVDTIYSWYPRLSEAEQRIADFILKNAADIAQLSVRDIAQQSKTSGATVSRFVRHIGFDTFSDLRLTLARYDVYDDSQNLKSEVISFENISGSVELILSNRIQELKGTATQLTQETLNRVVNLITTSDTILFAAVGNSIPVCSNAAFKLGQIGMRANCPVTTESMVLSSISLRRNDLLILLSTSGYSKRLEAIVDNAEDSGTPIIMITANPEAILASRCDLVIKTVSRDQILSGTQFPSHIAQDFVLETIFSLVLAHSKTGLIQAKVERKSLIEDKNSPSVRLD